MTPEQFRECYASAKSADEAFTDALNADGLDRWYSPKGDWTDPVRNAYEAKITADEAMRQAWIAIRKTVA